VPASDSFTASASSGYRVKAELAEALDLIKGIVEEAAA
jgi:hypothetical protein